MDNSEHAAYLEQNRSIWDKEAQNFDKEPDHGLGDASVRSAWKALLEDALPEKGLEVLDIGCGTGSLSLLLAELEHQVTGADLSPEMITLAESKAGEAKAAITFHVMDAAFPEFGAGSFDVILSRHLLWTLPKPREVLQRWANLLKPQGRLLLIEGFWHTGAGLHAQDVLAMLPESQYERQLTMLSEQADLWGQAVTDERYMIGAKLK